MTVVTEQPESEKDENIQVLDEAIQRLKDGDDGAHWEPVVIQAARQLLCDDKPLFQRKRSELKKASTEAQITDWTKEVKGSADDLEDSSKADEIVELVTELSELFHDGKGICYATFNHEGHFETWAIGSIGFNDWLGFKAYTDLGFSPSETAIKQAITSLNGIAKYEGQERDVYLRCAPSGNGYFIDLCNAQWQVVNVSQDGWEIVSNPSVKFTRSNTSAALPIPTSGNLELLWQHVNIPEKQRPLATCFLLEAWRPDTPFAIMQLTGEQGSAKSSTHKRLRQISDPNSVPLRVAPRTVEDLYVSAANNWQASFENMSNLSTGMQDALCALATGGGVATRKLYSDADESVIEVQRPVIINGITSVTTRPDLIDRTIALHLPKISESDRKRDTDLDKAFIQDAPAIFAGLLDLFSATLRELPGINIEKPPRMIDFAYLGEAMCAAQGMRSGSFNMLYKENRCDSLAHSLDSSPAALAVQEMAITMTDPWEGTLKQLKSLLDNNYHQEGEGWPRSPRGLGETLRRMAPALRELGVEIHFIGHKRDGSHVRIHSIPHFFELQNNRHNGHTVTDSPKNVGSLDNFRDGRDDVTDVTVKMGNKKMPKRDMHTQDEVHQEVF